MSIWSHWVVQMVREVRQHCRQTLEVIWGDRQELMQSLAKIQRLPRNSSAMRAACLSGNNQLSCRRRVVLQDWQAPTRQRADAIPSLAGPAAQLVVAREAVSAGAPALVERLQLVERRALLAEAAHALAQHHCGRVAVLLADAVAPQIHGPLGGRVGRGLDATARKNVGSAHHASLCQYKEVYHQLAFVQIRHCMSTSPCPAGITLTFETSTPQHSTWHSTRRFFLRAAPVAGTAAAAAAAGAARARRGSACWRCG